MGVWDKALSAARGEEPEKVPIVLFTYSMVLKRFCGVTEYEYYQNVKLQLEAKIAFQRRFPQVLNLYMAPEYGELHIVPTAFGAQLEWMKDAPPWVKEYPIKSPEDVDKLAESGIPEPGEVEVAAVNLGRYEYLYEWFPKDLREEYGYVDGWVYPGLCVEGAALTMGYDKFLVWMRRHPDVLHKWLRLATDFVLKYCTAVEERVGRCKGLLIIDHTASMMGRKHFDEFVLPYLNKVFQRYPKAFRIWHNEGSVGHILDAVDKINAEIWHFGAFDSPKRCKAETHFCLMGNIHPPTFAESSPEHVEDECRKLIAEAGGGGKLWLSTGGGMSPNTPLRNVEAMTQAVEKYGIYPLRLKSP